MNAGVRPPKPHPRHGPHDPVMEVPDRAPGSIRRTTSIDCLRRDGIDGPLTMLGIGRDLVTDPHGHPFVVAIAFFHAEIDYVGGRHVTAMTSMPTRPQLRELIGVRAASGFRTALVRADTGLAVKHPLLFALLDDVPVATLVSGHAVNAALRVQPSPPTSWRPVTSRPDARRRLVDQCAGFADGGTIMDGYDYMGTAPVVTGPPTPELASTDVLAFHDLPVLARHGMRRLRRLDVSPAPGGQVLGTVHFRDSHMSATGLHSTIHEYLGEFAAGPEQTITHCSIEPRVLPWVECPVAAQSAERLVGQPLSGLRSYVQTHFTGTSTCTHLNDTLRSLAGVPDLITHVAVPT